LKLGEMHPGPVRGRTSTRAFRRGVVQRVDRAVALDRPVISVVPAHDDLDEGLGAGGLVALFFIYNTEALGDRRALRIPPWPCG